MANVKKQTKEDACVGLRCVLLNGMVLEWHPEARGAMADENGNLIQFVGLIRCKQMNGFKVCQTKEDALEIFEQTWVKVAAAHIEDAFDDFADRHDVVMTQELSRIAQLETTFTGWR